MALEDIVSGRERNKLAVWLIDKDQAVRGRAG